MELYLLDRLFRRIQVIDKFESLIWTERFQEYGDFELKIKSTRDLRTRLIPRTWFAFSESRRVMMIEEIEDTSDEDGEILLITGRSFEKIFTDRFLKESNFSVGTWYITTSPIGAPQAIVDHVIGNPENPFAEIPQLNFADNLPMLSTRQVPPDEFAVDEGIEEVIDWSQSTPDTLYNELRRHCIPYNLGFRVVLDDEEHHLYFEAYTGRDLTTRQANRDPVIFSIDMGNLRNTKQFESIKNFKNVIYVYTDKADEGEATYVTRSPLEGPPAQLRRQLHIIHTSVPDDWNGTPVSYLKTVGEAELARQERRVVNIFDGEVNQNNQYKYGVDYELGDIVELRNRDGERTYKHVSEQIFVSDLSGERSYPTLSIGKFDEAATWRVFNEPQLAADTWEDFQFTQEGWGTM